MNRIAILLLSLFMFFNHLEGQTYKQQFNSCFSKKDTAGMRELLPKWEAADNNDPEMYVAYFNYYVNRSKTEFIELGNNPKGENVLKIMSTDTTKKQAVGYMYGNASYNPQLLKKGFDYADKGILKNPSRLDIRFGKIYMYGELKDWKAFTEEIIKTIDYSEINKNKWIWTDNKAVEKPKEFMLSTIQEYQLKLYDTNDDDLLENMKQIAEAVLKYYPDHVESLSDLSIVYLIKKDNNKALEVLLKAEKLAPTDAVVLNNIAETYKRMGTKNNAVKYYNLTIKYGDEEQKTFAKKQIEIMNKK
ncbi:MAG: tetratricopeptide repeat protein [Bacteroidetes bacterium]|nr:tetratricopeptide repeat protein [Bacteroidota bacterium]